ncbi:hypothetical protein D3C76_1461410 [compost metagenome]
MPGCCGTKYAEIMISSLLTLSSSGRSCVAINSERAGSSSASTLLGASHIALPWAQISCLRQLASCGLDR